MSELFLRIISHLLPRSQAWVLTRVSKSIRKLFEGLTSFPEEIKTFIDLVFLDCFPATTRELDAFDDQFALPASGIESERRVRLAGSWTAQGGQDPRYIQDALQAAGFDVYVHEWFEPPAGYPPGASVVRHPLEYISPDSSTAIEKYITIMCGVEAAVCGGLAAVAGAYVAQAGYLLVNKILFPFVQYYGCGNEEVNSGHAQAVCGRSTGDVLYARKQYPIPTDPLLWRYFIYIGGETFPDLAQVSEDRRNEFETLVLKIRPSHLWLGMLIDYT